MTSRVLLCAVLAALAAAPEDELIGLWGYSTSFGPMLQGELVLARTEGRWRASFGGTEAAVEVDGTALRAVFPEGIGKFRGALIESGRAIRGFWIRPAVTDDPRYPGGSTQAFSTPVTLDRFGANEWRGDVVPLKDRFRLYLSVFRHTDGMLLGAFRDPYMNRTGGASRFRVTREGETVAFSQPTEAGGWDRQLEATLVREPDRLRIRWPDPGREIELRRHAPDDITQFFPRPPGHAPYVYERPKEIGDGWSTARGKDVGIDEAAIARVVETILDGDPAARRPSLVHSFLVARHGKLVVEEYFFGFDRDTPHDMRSAGKTFASVMLGAARMRGLDLSPESSVYALVAARGPFANPDPRKARITLAHLMTHTSGLACDDNDEASPGNEDTMETQTREPDWWQYTLDLPMAPDPGTRYAYCSANMNLVGAALTAATKTWLPQFFDDAVARPLGFGPYHWNLMPTEEGYLGGGSWLRPRDLLKVGQAYLDGGVWHGRRIVDKEWIALSTSPRIHISPQTTGLSEEEFGNYYGEGDDAYAWHLGSLHAGEKTYLTYGASGNGGQLLVVAPELDLVFVFTGGNYLQGGIWSRWPDEIVGAHIVPSMKNGSATYRAIRHGADHPGQIR
jgi:CubicO group peptidase (beta-lactamase class C family)